MSPFELARSLQTQVTQLLRSFDMHDLPAAERQLLQSIKRHVADVRLDLRAYGTAETKAEQEQAAISMRELLTTFDGLIVQAGGLGLFGTVDVAHLSAITEQLKVSL
jgi:hypothetical protein